MRLIITPKTPLDGQINKTTTYTIINNRFTVYHKGAQCGKPLDIKLGDIVYVNFTDGAKTPIVTKSNKSREDRIADLLGFSAQKQLCQSEDLLCDILNGQQNYPNLSNMVYVHQEGRYGFILGDISTHTDAAKKKGLPPKVQQTANIKIWIHSNITTAEISELVALYTLMSHRSLSDEVLLALPYQ